MGGRQQTERSWPRRGSRGALCAEEISRLTTLVLKCALSRGCSLPTGTGGLNEAPCAGERSAKTRSRSSSTIKVSRIDTAST